MERNDGRRANEPCAATAEEKPAALVNRWTVSRHEGPAWGDPGSVDETEAGGGGLGTQKESLEEPPTNGGGPGTMDAEASKGEEGPVRHLKLRQHLGKNGPRRKSIRQETVPRLEERVRPRRERVSVGREIDGAAVIVRGGK